MPTNFTVSSQPALRCVTGETYPLSAAEHAAGFFTRLRVAERLVIHSGPQQAQRLPTSKWAGSGAQLGLATGFSRKISHA